LDSTLLIPNRKSAIENLKSFNDPIRPRQHVRRNRDADLFGRFQVGHQCLSLADLTVAHATSIISPIMAKTPEQVDELLKLVRHEDIATLRALERQIHSLLEQKEKDVALRRRGETDRDLLSKRCPNVPIDPDLLALVGIHPENPVEDDKALIREIVARRLTD